MERIFKNILIITRYYNFPLRWIKIVWKDLYTSDSEKLGWDLTDSVYNIFQLGYSFDLFRLCGISYASCSIGWSYFKVWTVGLICDSLYARGLQRNRNRISSKGVWIYFINIAEMVERTVRCGPRYRSNQIHRSGRWTCFRYWLLSTKWLNMPSRYQTYRQNNSSRISVTYIQSNVHFISRMDPVSLK